MGEVAITVKVTPESPETDLDGIKETVNDKFSVKDSEEESIGFGLSALNILIVRDEEGGGTDDIENYIQDIEGVSSTEIENVTLV